ncbi:MAG TPA: hypothetical protein ENG51_00340 [Deltaproteobacteria bacterium]|nr:MAG: hypothetical protein DRG83_08600 [Deltaproteobacteria bacterium]RLB08663.1 MAG: hypothetical protein DRG59_04415 [Deltaproteobacteria bacterium]HDM74902.1 hypothetical protein [Deltaproteobacteria bacterium]
MQENLDVLISFVVVIIGLSVFLQIIVEVIKNFLRLRWAVYEQFLIGMYRQFFSDKIPDVGAMQITERTQRYSMGSILERFKEFQNIIHTLASDLRIIRKSLISLEKKLTSTPIEKTETVRAHLLDFAHETSHEISRLLVIDFDDLFQVYKKLTSRVGLELHSDRLSKLQELYRNLLGIMKNAGVQSTNLGALKSELLEKIRELNDVLDGVEEFILKLHHEFSTKGESLLRDLENRYLRQISKWTFFIGLAMVLILNADSIVIYRTLRDTPAIRASIMKKVDLLTESVNLSSVSGSINELTELANKIKQSAEEQGQLDRKLISKFYKNYLSLCSLMERESILYRELDEKTGVNANITLPHSFKSLKSGIFEELKKYMPKGEIVVKLDESQVTALTNTLDEALFKLSRNFAALQIGSIEAQKRLLYSMELPLGWTWERLKPILMDISDMLKKIFGLVITAVLISFGAPFWNDILKSLLGLKSFLRKSQGKKGPTGAISVS